VRGRTKDKDRTKDKARRGSACAASRTRSSRARAKDKDRDRDCRTRTAACDSNKANTKDKETSSRAKDSSTKGNSIRADTRRATSSRALSGHRPPAPTILRGFAAEGLDELACECHSKIVSTAGGSNGRHRLDVGRYSTLLRLQCAVHAQGHSRHRDWRDGRFMSLPEKGGKRR